MSAIKQQLFAQLALMGQSLASPQRIELLDYLAQAERSVEELSRLSGLSMANTSRHLQLLKKAGLVSMRKLGKQRLYSLGGDDIINLIQQLRRSAETHLAEVERLKSRLTPDRYASRTISSEELAKQLQNEALTLLDVRPSNEFAEGHIKGAWNVPPDRIEQILPDLPKNKPIVAYCRGPYCVYSYQMVQRLRQQGIQALRLEEGFPEWKAAGLPFEQDQAAR